MKVYNIKWETDDFVGEVENLPTEVEVPNHLSEFEIADYLSNEYCWLVESFECDELCD
jgi:hypothetical protein